MIISSSIYSDRNRCIICVCSIMCVKTVKTKGKPEAFVLAHIYFHRLLALSI